MAHFEYSKFDGSEQFKPQSADAVFDELTRHMLDWGDDVLDYLDQWEEEHPDVVDMLIKRGYVEKDSEGKYYVTPKGIRRVESKALEELFQIARKDKLGKHETEFRGAGQTVHDESKPYEFGDPVSNLNMHETLKNALLRQGGGSPVHISEEDLVVYDTEYQTSCATVVLLDMSGSMTRFGKFGQAKKVAMALQSLVRSRYQGDFLQVVGFYTYASPLTERQLLSSAPKPVSLYDSRIRLRINLDRPPRFVPEHFTNIHAGLQFARRILRRHPAQNKQIIIVTDGEPTAHIEGREIVLIYPPAEQTARLTLAEAKRCADEGLTISSFALVEDYFYLGLVNFVERLATVTRGVAAFCNADDLGNMVIESFVGGRKRRRAI
ncbi:MAG TPA: VWA domain-containing protein [Planctomycetaceae bacterium]|nr:VWA domain-containing protein [Planctomycetaceae bacterium]